MKGMNPVTARTLKILAPTRYPWKFNGPRYSRHDISIRNFIPFNYISNKYEGITVFNPFPLRHFDLVHAFNRIPIGPHPFVIGFESHLPRGFGINQTAFFRQMRRALASDRCGAIIAISDHARRQFLHQHADTPEFDRLKAKLHLRYPNLPIADGPDPFKADEAGEIRLVFIGNHFGRKGGSVAVQMADLANQRGLPLRIDIVSTIEVGAASWTDPLSEGYFDQDRRRLALPNIRHSQNLSNEAVLALVAQAHFALLPTFSDTFGYSAIEAMSRYTPVVATAQAALPEFIRDGDNGILLPLDVDDFGEWMRHIEQHDRTTPGYASLHRAEVNRLAELALDRVWAETRNPDKYLALRQNARATAIAMFSAQDANRFWDDFYLDYV